MAPGIWALLRLSAALGASASAAAAVEYVLAPGSFCSPGSGCDQVRTAAGALGAALPAVGLGGFSSVFLLSLLPAALAHRMALAAAALGAVVGILLLGLQAFWVHTFCPLCVTADAAGIALGLCAIALWRGPIRAAGLPAALHLAWYLLIAGAPVAWALARPAELPSQIADLWEPGAINVVELSDFECPYCRALHPHLAAELAKLGNRVHFVRMSYPLPGHRHAGFAAAAYLCAAKQRAGEAMADALFRAEDLSPAGCLAIAEGLRLDGERMRECMGSAATRARIEANMALVRATGFRGLPTVWIGATRIEGFDRKRGAAPYHDALARAASGERPGHRPAPWLALGGATCAIAAFGLLRLRHRQRPHAAT